MSAGNAFAQLARLGSATVYEAAGRAGLVDADFTPVIPGARACGPARPVLCGQDDNLMVHAAMAAARPGDVLVLTMPEPRPVALIGDLLATQAKTQGVAALVVDASVRDVEDLEVLGLPIWTRWIRIRGAGKDVPGTIDAPVTVGGARIAAGDAVVLDADGIAIVAADRIDAVLAASYAREERERVKRDRLKAGALSYDLDGLRERVEGA
ncbi:MAG TPA: 4-carboxy-4-hydroxy-2-oxoadipate aldolase/oxaloacetate decarboxylase [Baekduia sp.]